MRTRKEIEKDQATHPEFYHTTIELLLDIREQQAEIIELLRIELLRSVKQK